MRVVFQQADLDTCLTALVLGFGPEHVVRHAHNGASAAELADPDVCCIEAGGSGEVACNNFDHHAPDGPVTPACQQALLVTGGDSAMKRLVAYVTAVDTAAGGSAAAVPFPSLSALFSGLRLSVTDPVTQFREGVELQRRIWHEGHDPFAPIAIRPEWASYVAAKRANGLVLGEARRDVIVQRSRHGLLVGAVETEAIGAVGLVYQMGCAIAVGCIRALASRQCGR